MKKRILSLVVAMIMVLSMFAGISTTSFAEDSYGVFTYHIDTNSKSVVITDCDESASGEVVIPDTIDGYPVVEIRDYTFSNCTNIEKIVIPDSVTTYGLYHVYSGIKYISVSENNPAFLSDEYGVLFNKDKTILLLCPDKTEITEYVIPDSVTEIGMYAFTDCINIKKIVIPDSVKSIGGIAFAGASSLSEITIPDSIEFFISGNALHYNYKNYYNLLAETAYYADESNWENGLLYCGNHVIDYNDDFNSFSLREGTIGIAGMAFYNLDDVGEIVIPESVKVIGDFAFSGSSTWGGIKNITILGELTHLGTCVFYKRANLASVKLPDSITFIGNSAFSECDSLKEIDLPTNLETIDYYAFEGCDALEKVSIPATVKTIMTGAFTDCNSLSDIYYAGSEQEWNLIEIGYIRGFSDVIIHFSDTCSHSFTEAKDAVDATCTQNGSTGDVSCKACGEIISSGEVIPATGHTFGDWIIDKEANCTENGSKSHRCEKCGETADVTEIPAKGHTFGEWTITAEATYFNAGEMTRKCSVCDEIETQVIAKLETTKESVDEKSNIAIRYQDDSYNGEMKIEAVQQVDGEAFQILNNEKGDFESILFDITTTVDGEKVQPNGYVLVGIPLPDGYTPETTVVYFVANDGSGLVKMNSYYEDGYIWFETNHFSPYAIVDESETVETYILGDANGDGKVTAADARIVLRTSARLENLDGNLFLAADVNKDSKITAADARKILRVSAKIESF